MSPEQSTTVTQNRNPRRRVRRYGHHRGWIVRTPACIARNICESLWLHEDAGNYQYGPEHYTDDPEILALVYEMLDR